MNGLAINANKLVHDVMRLLSSVVNVRPERSDPMVTKVEEITPVLEVPTIVSEREAMKPQHGVFGSS